MHTEKCFAFSPQEVERIVQEYDPNAKVEYRGGRVTAVIEDMAGNEVDEFNFEEIVAEMRPELGIGGKAEAIYEQNYQTFRADSTVLVIDNVWR